MTAASVRVPPLLVSLPLVPLPSDEPPQAETVSRTAAAIAAMMDFRTFTPGTSVARAQEMSSGWSATTRETGVGDISRNHTGFELTGGHIAFR